MTPVPLDKTSVLNRVNGIQGELVALRKLATLPFPEFRDGDGFELAQFHLHHAVEGIFHIASHILSRIPGARASGYKDMAVQLGKHKIVDKQFAEGPLKNIAGYRNRLVHFYADITPEEIQDILNNHLKDIETFLKAVRAVLSDPEKYGIAKA